MDRRTFLRWMAGAAVAGGVGAAGSSSNPGTLPTDVAWRRYSDRWISYVTERPHVQPGLWTLFTTTCRECPAGCGMHVRSREGRVVKPEGNPGHPVSRGGLCPRGQSAPQGLYDPDRVHQPLRRSSGVEGLRGSSRQTPNGDRSELRNRNRLTSLQPVPLEQFASVDLQEGFEPISWSQATNEAAQALKKARRLIILSDLQTGALAEVIRQFHQEWMKDQESSIKGRSASSAPNHQSEVAFYEAFDYEPLRAANEKLFERAVIPRYRLQECDFILSLGAEFLETWISNVEFAWEFAQMHHGGPADRGPQSAVAQIARRQTPNPADPSSPYRLPLVSERPAYVGEMAYIGPRLSMTAANADYFVQVRAGQEYAAALAILQEVRRRKGLMKDDGQLMIESGRGGLNHQSSIISHQLDAVAARLAGAKRAVVLAGPVGARGPAAERLALAAMQLNQAVGAVGRTVDFSQPHALSLTTPVSQVEQMLQGLGPEDALIVHQTNPAYSLPHLREVIGRAGSVVFIGPMMNETARLAQWVLPTETALQEWGDYEPWTGLHCLIQPTMGRMYDTRHSGDVFLALAESYGRPLQRDGQTPESFLDWLRLRWRQLHRRLASKQDFEVFWREALQRGGFFEPPGPGSMGKMPMPRGEQPGTSVQPVDVSEPPEVVEEAPAANIMHLWLWPSILWFDGRLANRGWLQEVPERMSTLTWGSWLDISRATALRLNVERGDVLEVSNAAGKIRAPVRITPEVADNVVALALGQGHTALGLAAAGRGMNGFELLRARDAGSLFGTVDLRKTGEHAHMINLSATQDQWGRDIIRWVSRQKLRTMSESDVDEITWPGPAGYKITRDLYPPHYYPKHRWAMAIDLDRCIGCGACAVACYAENSVPVMGPRPLDYGREMAWLKIPPYRHPDDPLRIGFLVLPCQQCDAAPCEPVCPVFAAVHNDQGLNAQIYNRCVGTRYCSNNCPYKVRRFEWFDPQWREPLHLQLNPDVMVRCRGVMEKCTFCIQRIQYHERLARVEQRDLREDEIQPACVQSCPTRAYVFGDLMRTDSEVYRLFHHPRRYQLLRELNTKPAIVYLKRILPEEERAKGEKAKSQNS